MPVGLNVDCINIDFLVRPNGSIFAYNVTKSISFVFFKTKAKQQQNRYGMNSMPQTENKDKLIWAKKT